MRFTKRTVQGLVSSLLLLSFMGMANAACNGADNRFTDNGNGTISDQQTGLIWSKCPLGLSGAGCSSGILDLKTWSDALAAAKNSNLATYMDWRLPNIKELESIVERSCASPAINKNYFPNTPASIFSSFFFSASPDNDNRPNFALGINFSKGHGSRSFRVQPRHVRFVRGSQ